MTANSDWLEDFKTKCTRTFSGAKVGYRNQFDTIR